MEQLPACCHGKDILFLILRARPNVLSGRVGMETRESIIADLRRLGVKVNQMLAYHPSDQQLKEMRDGMLRLHKANPTKNY
jgi:hypothetical protein